jgi:hypothetical protein
MGKSKPSCWRAFWITAIVVGVVNAALAAYYWSLPIERIPKFGRYGRDPAGWLVGTAVAINLPGIIFATPIIIWSGCQSDVIQITMAQVLGTIFWALIAARLEQDIPLRGRRPASPS